MNFHSVCLVLLGALAAAFAANKTDFTTNKTAKFLVNSVPDIVLPQGDAFSGLLPITSNTNETRELFFFFWPTSNPEGSKEITFWLTGGSGCSSMSGMITESGPCIWASGESEAVNNPWSLHHLTHVLYVDQALGTGLSKGTPDITNNTDLSVEFVGFYKNFLDTFDLKNYDTYLFGESYAGSYVPAIASAFIDAHSNATKHHEDSDYFTLAGASLHSPLIGDFYAQQEMTTLAYAEKC